jgi:acetate kinase
LLYAAQGLLKALEQSVPLIVGNAMAIILTVNAGSSSIRLAGYEVDNPEPRRIAAYHGEHAPREARTVLAKVLGEWRLGDFSAVAHRIVHGGKALTHACILDDAVEAEIERLTVLAPLHHPPALAWIRACREALGREALQVAVLDTAFYAALPRVAATYALPRALCEKYGLHRYGFHGLAHEALWRRWRELGGATKSRVISLQLGSGCSITATRQGQPVDTSMGFSPLEGLVMATRCGDVDPGLLIFLQRAAALEPDALERLLNRESGLLGVSGLSDEMRTLLAAHSKAARQAVDLYCYRARKYIGAYLAVLDGADAILFGGGVGENAPEVRARILAGMEWAGIVLDQEANRASGSQVCISSKESRVALWVIPVDESQILAREALAVIAQR